MFTRRPLHRGLGLVLALLFLGSFLGEPRGMVVPGAQAGDALAAGPLAAPFAALQDDGDHGHHAHDAPEASPQDGKVAADPAGGHGSHSEGPDPHCQILCATTAVFDPTIALPVGVLLGLLNPRAPSARVPETHLLAAAVAHPFLLPFGQAPPTSVL
jgi:hypothetical protein